MIKNMLLEINTQIRKLFQRQTESPEAHTAPVKQSKNVKHVSKLKKEIKETNKGYNKSIRKLQFDYDRLNQDYQKAYNEYQLAFKKRMNGVISEDDLKVIESNIQPHKTRLEDAGEELDRVEGFKKEDNVKLVNEIESLQDAYIKEIAEQLNEDADAIQELKQAYLNKVATIGNKYQEVIDTKNLVNQSMKQYNYTYDSKLVEMLEVSLKEVPLKLNDLMIDGELINQSLKQPLRKPTL